MLLYNVSINGTYQGLYVLMEEINGGMVKLDKVDSMAMLFKDPPVFYKEELGHVQDSTNYYQQKFPKIYDSDKTSYIEAFKNFLFDSDDADFAKNLSEWVDIDNVVDWWHLMLLFSNNSDGIMKNFYLYKLNEDTPFRFAIWDYDHSFGRDGDNEMNLMERELDCNRSVVLKRLSSISAILYHKMLKERWFFLRKQDVISVKNFEKLIDGNDLIIGNEVDKNFEKWPVGDDWYYDANTYKQELDLMMKFVNIRIAQLDEYFSNY